MSDPGERVVDFIYKQMQIDPQWSVRRERGFTWWASSLAQHVWADAPIEDGGVKIHRVHARTDLLDGFTGSGPQLSALAMQAAFATMSAPIRDPDNPTRIQLASGVNVHEQNEGWLRARIALCTAIQVTEAHILGPLLAQMTGCKVASSPHPTAGRRVAPDDMLNIIKQAVAPLGRTASKWRGPEMEQAVTLLQRPPCVMVNGSEGGFAAEFPFPEGTSLLIAETDEANPRLGNGCLLRLTLPVLGSEQERSRLALELNEREATTFTRAHLLGSWCAMGPGVTFVSFLPNAAHAPLILTNMIMSSVMRVRWVTHDVFGFDLDQAFGAAFKEKQAWIAALQSETAAKGRRPWWRFWS